VLPDPAHRTDAQHQASLLLAAADVKRPHMASRMSKSTVVSVVALAAALVLAIALNPSAERHRARIKEAIAERSPIAGALGVGSLAAFASSYHSLGVFSYTTAGDRTLSVGVLGMVFVLQ